MTDDVTKVTTIIAEVETTTKAHTQVETMVDIFYYPAHEPRSGDKHYPLFNAARKRLKKAGLLVCWRCGATENIELHHNIVEFALANGVDVAKFQRLYPDLLPDCSDEAFAVFVEGEGNLSPLCHKCHTGTEGIHSLPYPNWVAGRFWKIGQPPPAEKKH